VSFSKGCYVGQEVVSRMHHRHSARNRLLPLSFEGEVLAGAEVTGGGQRLGHVTSVLGGCGLALLRLDRLAEAGNSVVAAGVHLQVRKPDWARFDMTFAGGSP
jgi:tRNA-modifying protein YgfZ